MSSQQAPPAYDQAKQPPSYDQPQQQQDPYVSYPKVHGSGDAPAYQSSSWGSPVMGDPSKPSAHPANQQAAMQTRPELKEGKGFDEPGVGAAAATQLSQAPNSSGYVMAPQTPQGSSKASPYVQTSAVPSSGSSPSKSPMETIVESLNKWGKQAEGMAENVWNHLKVGPSMTDTAWGKLSHGAKVITEGGYENVFKQTFGALPNERLRQQAMSYYKLVVPLEKLRAVNPSTNPERPLEKYIQVSTIDNHEFWFMGFVNYDKGVKNLQLALNNREGFQQNAPPYAK